MNTRRLSRSHRGGNHARRSESGGRERALAQFTFDNGQTIALANRPDGVAAGDWDGDMIPNLAVTNQDDRTVGVYSNDGSANFSGPTTLSVGGQVRPSGIAAGDLDGDTDMDLAVPNEVEPQMYLVHFREGAAVPRWVYWRADGT